ncbi:hypothetical protein SAMN05421874_128104 [Nonomuraea maritima]|uniref:PIN domain-containing protein n=1 Tax=Nonomuraea maritima TaxID=683260 RepID=A0A1G9MMN4_9ACTN|nr:hypothetical protein [Nonomuraea maritima]SDL75479.1 hypothetical protein SAMN05421874_128104 [Nonomuraea maritima]
MADGYVLDALLLAEVSRGDPDVIALLQELDASQIPMIVPALAITGATVETAATADQLAVMRGVGRLGSTRLAALSVFDDSVDLAHMRKEMEGDLWDVQTALQAVLRGCPILTVDGTHWETTARALWGHLVVVQVSQLDE